MEKEFNLWEKREKLRKDIDYLFSKIDFAHSFLDAQATTIMNEFWKDLIDADKEFVGKVLSLGVLGFGDREQIKIWVGDKLT